MLLRDVALPPAREALDRAGKSPEDVDLIILATDSPDSITPATSVALQHTLGVLVAFGVGYNQAAAAFRLQRGRVASSSLGD